MTTINDMTDIIRKANWYSETLSKINDGTFSYKWLNERLTGESQPAFEAMHVVMDLIREKQQKEINDIIAENKSFRRVLAHQFRLLGCFCDGKDGKSEDE